MSLHAREDRPTPAAPRPTGFLRTPGLLNDRAPDDAGADFTFDEIPPALRDLVPAHIARQYRVVPLDFDGETLTLASADADSIALADKLRFLLAKDVRLVAAEPGRILDAIDRAYGEDSAALGAVQFDKRPVVDLSAGPMRAVKCMTIMPRRSRVAVEREGAYSLTSLTHTLNESTDESPESGMFFYTVREGERALMTRRDGSMHVITGPKRVWRWGKTFERMQQHVAHPGKFLAVHYRDGRQEHIPGPAELWLDPRVHLHVACEDALQLAAKEAVVVYTEAPTGVTRRLVFGPAVFVPQPGEWLHTFSWHASKGGSRGQQKIPNALVFQKLWLMPDQMYHDVTDVRTADDAVLTVRLMIFFELTDIERMLEATHDPIGDFVNAATSDVVAFTGRYDFEAFKRAVIDLNELGTYRQLTGRAAQCGYRINKVVYRGYGSADALQLMHDQAIQARTKLQLDRATEQQAQELENYKLDCQLARAATRRQEQTSEVEHDLQLAARRQEADLTQREAQQAFLREARRREAEVQSAIERERNDGQRAHLAALRELGVELTQYLTQGRADQVIELRGGSRAHLHLDRAKRNAEKDGK